MNYDDLFMSELECQGNISGLILACVPLCYIVVCPIAGKLLDRFSSKKMLLIASGMNVATQPHNLLI